MRQYLVTLTDATLMTVAADRFSDEDAMVVFEDAASADRGRQGLLWLRRADVVSIEAMSTADSDVRVGAAPAVSGEHG